jgi:hypothetical protein
LPHWPLYAIENKKTKGKKEKEKTVNIQTLLNVTKKGDLGVVSHVTQIGQWRNQSQLHSWVDGVITKLS